jgi:glucoamylase
VIADSARACILLRTALHAKNGLDSIQTYLLCAPHLDSGGNNNNAYIVEAAGRQILTAKKQDTWMAVGASCEFSRLSCGYVGASDGYTDLATNHKMTFAFDRAIEGNVGLMAQLDLSKSLEFTVGLAFGETLDGAVATLFQSLNTCYADHLKVFMRRWERAASIGKPLDKQSADGGWLYDSSYLLLLAHEDKTYQGALH